MIFRNGLERRAARRSIAIGLAVTLVLIGAGAFYAYSQPRVWTAESMVVVLPGSELDDATSASYYETLSRGQIVATFAEVAGNLRFEQRAADRLALSAEQRSLVQIEVTVVPNTAVILVRATAGEPDVAQQMSAATTELSVEYLAGLSKPYRAVPVLSGTGGAAATGMPRLLLLAAAVGAALVAGLAVQQAVYHLSLALRGTAERPSDGSPEIGQHDAAAPRSVAAAR
jgi:capsular polysaccharide biosynthesis protein